MKCENKVGKEFDSIAQRLAYSYMALYSKFVPADIKEVTVEAQKQTHDFLGGVLCKIYENPAIIGLPLDKDDCFDGEMFKDKPELTKKMKSLEKKFLGFFDFIYEFGVAGELRENKLYIANTKMKPQKSKLALLEQIGLKSEIIADGVIIYSDEYPELCSGLKCLSAICELADGDMPNRITKQSTSREMFMRCLFDFNNVSLDRLYGDFEQSGPYLKELEDYFISKGYGYHNYSGLHKAYPNKQSGSFKVGFGWKSKNQLGYGIDAPSVRVLIEHFNEMDDELKDFVFSRTNICNNCGYCAQIGKKEIVAVKLTHNGETLIKCPYYPGFGWGSLDEKIVSVAKKFCDFYDDVLFRV